MQSKEIYWAAPIPLLDCDPVYSSCLAVKKKTSKQSYLEKALVAIR